MNSILFGCKNFGVYDSLSLYLLANTLGDMHDLHFNFATRNKHGFICMTHQRSTVSDFKAAVVSAGVLVQKRFLRFANFCLGETTPYK
jgi:hypothetical protein